MTVFLTVYQFALGLYRHMALTAIQVKEAKPSDKDQKLSDGEGMYLLVKKNGSKYWRMGYIIAGKRKTYFESPANTVHPKRRSASCWKASVANALLLNFAVEKVLMRICITVDQKSFWTPVRNDERVILSDKPPLMKSRISAPKSGTE